MELVSKIILTSNTLMTILMLSELTSKDIMNWELSSISLSPMLDATNLATRSATTPVIGHKKHLKDKLKSMATSSRSASKSPTA